MPINMGVGGAALGNVQSGQQPVTTGQGNQAMMPGQQLNYANMTYNANNANQNAMNMMQNAQGFNQGAFNQLYNPYIQNVVDANTAQANRNFNQQTAPALQSQFGMSGQPGSARAMATMEQANRDMNQQLNWQNAQLMQQGYNSAMDNYWKQQQGAQSAAMGMGALGQQANQMGMQQAMLPANYLATMSGALSGLKVPTMSQTLAGDQQSYFNSLY